MQDKYCKQIWISSVISLEPYPVLDRQLSGRSYGHSKTSTAELYHIALIQYSSRIEVLGCTDIVKLCALNMGRNFEAIAL